MLTSLLKNEDGLYLVYDIDDMGLTFTDSIDEATKFSYKDALNFQDVERSCGVFVDVVAMPPAYFMRINNQPSLL